MKLIASKKSFLLPQNHGYFNNCHASTLVKLPDGELLASFFAGEREGAGDVAIWLVSTRLGVWQAPVRQMAESGLAHWNPVLHTEGDTVWLFYKVGPTVHSWTTRWTSITPIFVPALCDRAGNAKTDPARKRGIPRDINRFMRKTPFSLAFATRGLPPQGARVYSNSANLTPDQPAPGGSGANPAPPGPERTP